MMKTRVHVLISGKVHGVWFRASTRQKAEQLGLLGWVKNTRDGKVEAVFEGEDDQIQRMISWCQHGPPLARVTNVDVQTQSVGSELSGFLIQ
ncbi:MAG: acylphosphatase [Methanobacteriota archaeon]